jgi:hypothetical protein
MRVPVDKRRAVNTAAENLQQRVPMMTHQTVFQRSSVGRARRGVTAWRAIYAPQSEGLSKTTPGGP